MRPILNRTSVFFVILISPLLVTGCSSDPRVEANQAIERANKDISAHDKLFDEARKSYTESQEAVRENTESTASESTEPESTGSESTNSGSTGPESTEPESPEARMISEARNKMQDARGRLEEARTEISGIQDLDVSDNLKEYSSTLEGALSAQMKAEEREIAFYKILSEDPALEENRERAMELLDEARQAYTEAENGYQEAAGIADSNQELVAPEGGGATGG